MQRRGKDPRGVAGGHTVSISHSHSPESLRDLVQSLGPARRAVTVGDAMEAGDIVVLAIPFGGYEELPRNSVDDKIVVDATNYYPERNVRDYGRPQGDPQRIALRSVATTLPRRRRWWRW